MLKILKIFFAILAVLAALVLAFESPQWGFWYNQARFKLKGFEPLTEAVNTRVLLLKIQGSSPNSDGNIVIAEEPKSAFPEAIQYAERMESDSLIIWRGGKLIVEKYWNDVGRDVQPETASMHKSVLGMLYVIAIGEGKLSPDDRIGEYIKEWKNDPRGNITVRQVLTMSAGFGEMSKDGGMFSTKSQFAFGRKSRKHVMNMPLVAEPGSTYYYRNAVSQIAGYVLESATGENYGDYLEQKLWQPIGAGDAYVWRNGAGTMPRTYSSLLARPIDWLKLGLLIKNNGMFNGEQILPVAPLTDMLTPSTTNPNYGWQIWLGNEWQHLRYYAADKSGFAVKSANPFLTDDMIYFDGFGGQRVYISRAYDLVVVRTGPVRMDWDDTALPNMIIKTVSSEQKLSNEKNIITTAE